MRQAHFLRGGLVLLAAGWAGSIAGCTHNYYYGTPVSAGGCPPTVAAPAGAVQYGSVCDVPTQVAGGSLVAQGPTRSTVVTGSPRPPQVVVSQPRGRGLFGWKPSDPDASLPTTQVAGAVDDSSTTR